MQPPQQSEVREWVDWLVSEDASDEERQYAADTLVRLGTRLPDGIRPRGNISSAAQGQPQLANAEHIEYLLKRAPTELSGQIALALGEWGGEEAAAALARVLEVNIGSPVALYYISALRTISGPVAMRGLCSAAERGPMNVRAAAISAIREIVNGGTMDDTDADVIRRREPVKTLSGRYSASAVSTLQGIRANKVLPLHLRLQAEEALRYL
jgi:hypothetical protein